MKFFCKGFIFSHPLSSSHYMDLITRSPLRPLPISVFKVLYNLFPYLTLSQPQPSWLAHFLLSCLLHISVMWASPRNILLFSYQAISLSSPCSYLTCSSGLVLKPQPSRTCSLNVYTVPSLELLLLQNWLIEFFHFSDVMVFSKGAEHLETLLVSSREMLCGI